MAQDKLAPAKELASRLIFATLQILKERGGQASGRDIVAEVEKRVELNDWAKTVYDRAVFAGGPSSTSSVWGA